MNGALAQYAYSLGSGLQNHKTQGCWYTPATLALGRQQEEGQKFSHSQLHSKFEVNLSYMRLYLKTKTKTIKKNNSPFDPLRSLRASLSSFFWLARRAKAVPVSTTLPRIPSLMIVVYFDKRMQNKVSKSRWFRGDVGETRCKSGESFQNFLPQSHTSCASFLQQHTWSHLFLFCGMGCSPILEKQESQ